MALLPAHQLSTFSSPTNGASPIDANTVRGNDNSIGTAYNAHDADATIHVQTSTLAARPAFGTVGRVWLTSDGLRAYYDTGAAWTEINYVPIIVGEATWVTMTLSGTLTQGTTRRRAGVGTSVATTATTIDSLLYSGIGHVVVTGADPGTNKFIDTVAYQAPGNVLVINTGTLQGAPAARTYTTTAGGVLQLAMASGIYNVKTAPQEIV